MIYRAALHLLAPFAIFGLLLHIAWGLATALLLFRFMSQSTRNRLIRFWSRVLLITVGVKLIVRGDGPDPTLSASGLTRRNDGQTLSRTHGQTDPQIDQQTDRPQHGLMLLANHVSWLDIYAINATVPTRFVAKAEIADWPVLGTLVASVGTLFVERGRRHAVHAINHVVGQRLTAGETIGVFPEGTTTGGDALLPFHANLVQPALDVHAQLRPIALRFSEDGRLSRAAAYVGDDQLLVSLWRVLTAPRLTAELHWLPPLPAVTSRHEAGRLARIAIARALDITLTPSGSAAHSGPHSGPHSTNHSAAFTTSPLSAFDAAPGPSDTARGSAADPAN